MKKKSVAVGLAMVMMASVIFQDVEMQRKTVKGSKRQCRESRMYFRSWRSWRSGI